MSELKYFTEEGLKRLKNELEELMAKERPRISQMIAEARDKGDLSENAEYDAAKEAQGMLEMQIAKLKEVVGSARVIDESKLDHSKVSILSKDKIKNTANGQELVYTLVPESEADVAKMRISVNTPIAKGLLGKVQGDVAEITLPNGMILNFEILEISLD